ncbi:carbohydrate kinase family protein [Alteromonas sp. CYL-A6]|uniref:carbohydrate kinase family protein n=1 Tax=Alteromonas nitratireducens TaxID=3390813 RepID=UPI0034C1FEAC
MMKLVCVGEVLIDMLAGPADEQAKPPVLSPFQPHAGGAPANVAVAVAKLGGQSALVSHVGDDTFGHYLINMLNYYQVDTTHVTISPVAKTALAFVSLDSDGERSFDFYLDNAAHTLLGPELTGQVTPGHDDIVHFCSGAVSTSLLKDGLMALLAQARESGALVSLDINFRPAFWDSPARAATEINRVVSHVDIVKTSLEELHALYGEDGSEGRIRQWLSGGVAVVLLTDGANPVRVITAVTDLSVPAPATTVKDTTAAGDAFIGGFLSVVADHAATGDAAREWLQSQDNLAMATHFAARCGAHAVSQYGAFTALPTAGDVK